MYLPRDPRYEPAVQSHLAVFYARVTCQAGLIKHTGRASVVSVYAMFRELEWLSYE